MAPGLNYGQQSFEGLKAYRSSSGDILVFRSDQNAERMQRSAAAVSIPVVPTDLFQRCVHLAVSLNAEFVPPHETGAAMYIRPLLFGSSAQLGLNPPEEYTFLVFVMPTGVYHGVDPVAALILEDFDRAAPEGTGAYKIGGNYAPILRFSERARKDGFGITLHLDSKTRTEVDEFSTSAFLGIKGTPDQGDVTIVLPDSKSVLKSVTAESACEIAQSFGWKVERRPVRVFSVQARFYADFSHRSLYKILKHSPRLWLQAQLRHLFQLSRSLSNLQTSSWSIKAVVTNPDRPSSNF